MKYNFPSYVSLEEMLRKKFGKQLTKMGAIADIVCGPFGSAIKNTDYRANGIPLIRITNITKDGYMDYSDLTYISEELGNDLSRTQVGPGDIIISQRGTLGQCAIVDDKFEKLNISANIIAIKNFRGVSAEFVRDYILSSVGRKQLERFTSGQVQQKITTQNVSDLLIPLNLDEQKLIDIIDEGYAKFIEKQYYAEQIVTKAKADMFKILGIFFPKYQPSLYSFQKLSDVLEYGIRCNLHSAYMNNVFEHMRKHKYYAGNLGKYVLVNPKTACLGVSNEDMVSFVPMSAVTEKVNQVLYEKRKYSEVKTGFTVFQKGDLLWAKITPCMQNGKSFLASDLPTEIGFGSTEFHVLRQNSEHIYMPYLWVLLSEVHILDAAQGMFSGSAGQQRVPDIFLEKFPIILPELNVQKDLADNVFKALSDARKIKEEAGKEWTNVKEEFEKILLG